MKLSIAPQRHRADTDRAPTAGQDRNRGQASQLEDARSVAAQANQTEGASTDDDRSPASGSASETFAQHNRAATRGRLRRNSIVDFVMTGLAVFVTVWLDILVPDRHEHVLDRWRRNMSVRFWTGSFGSAALCGLVAGIVLSR